eukprot:scaffold85962_cov43-Attheya_sp.AAC.1
MGSFDAASSGGSNADRFFQNGWLGWLSRYSIPYIMHLDWRQSTEIGARRIEFTPLLCLDCHLIPVAYYTQRMRSSEVDIPQLSTI